MKVLVIGNGGREHAIAWKAAASPRVTEVLVAPGNAGTAREARIRNVDAGAQDSAALIELAQREGVGLTIVGPEQPLTQGIVDRFDAAGLKCFGPTGRAARLEGSKAYAKEFMARHRIPTAEHAAFSEIEAALAYLRSRRFPVVVKADGLAAGKGVVIAETPAEGERALVDMLQGGAFGNAGATVVIEDFLRGEEASFIALVDGTDIVPLASSQDHKARDDGDRGPNTGGMGAYSPAPVVTAEVHERIMQRVMLPAVRGLAADGVRYRGFLYAGLMIDDKGDPQVLEFNCRLGDPETQPILFRLRSDLVQHVLDAIDGKLASTTLDWDSRPAVGVVMASAGYPGAYDKGHPIAGLDDAARYSADAKVFHAGTRLADGAVVTDGGRVLCAVARGTTVAQARDLAYDVAARISWRGAFYRKDIGHRAVQREQEAG
jgi:phosphoribosylamine--glycine ligase